METYLSGIGCSGSAAPGRDALRELHKKHVMSLPYDNSRLAEQVADGMNGGNIDLDAAFDEAVVARRGGHCGELAGLFHRLLDELGFDVSFLMGGLCGPGGTFGPDLAHVFLGVRLDGELWLADVGFAGPGFLEPVRVSPEVQEQYGCQYRVVPRGGYQVLERRARGGDWHGLYRFDPRPRELAEWNPGGDDADDAEQFGIGVVIRSRATENGQWVLLGRRLTTVDNGEERIRVLVKSADHDEVVREIMGGAA